MLDLERFIAGVHEYLKKAFKPLVERIAALEQLAPVPGPPGAPGTPGGPGQPGADGKSVTLDEVLAAMQPKLVEYCADHIKLVIAAQMSALVPGPPGEPGQPGADGKSVTLDEVLAAMQPKLVEFCSGRIEQTITAKMPAPVPGPPGEPGQPGADGKSVTLDDIRPLVEGWMATFGLDFERRAQDLLQRAIDRIPVPAKGKDGADGRDAFALEDFNVELGDDGRTLTLSFTRSDLRIERKLRLSHPIYRGVWREGDYLQGDSVTFGGSAFIAMRDTSSKPETDDSWRLAVKRGRDGKGS